MTAIAPTAAPAPADRPSNLLVDAPQPAAPLPSTDFLPDAEARRQEAHAYRSMLALLGRPVPQPRPGLGVPVVLAPGFIAGDVPMTILSRHLRRHDHRTFRSGIGANLGCTNAMVERLITRLEAVAAAEGRPVALVGHSRGGMIVNLVARRRPNLVASIVVLARVRSLFAQARKLAPSIIFIDEIDAIGGKRGQGAGHNDEREQTLNQLLAEMDGFQAATGVVVIAATNRVGVLDPALLRPGRFDRIVDIGLPTRAERGDILARHSAAKTLAADVDLGVLARGTPGFSGADLANLVNEAALHAVRADRVVIEGVDFDSARDRILLGRRDSPNVLPPAEKRAVAVHEGGHALVAMLSKHADPVFKVSILPAGQSLGVTHQLPVNERRLYPHSYLTDSLAVRLGGRAAETLVLGEASTGAADDLVSATDLATRMVRDWGLSTRVGPVSFPDAAPGAATRPPANETQLAIDEETARLLRDAEHQAVALLTAHRADLDRVVALLLEHETVTGADLAAAVASQAPSRNGHQPAASDLAFATAAINCTNEGLS